ncbi:metalloregulator ArsR/SmtB family transcription factor [Mechercharimyces sp. CAU 1602]|nr:metalloregulator ArsR/SmtB family transcription factor [Mechercharimyces sp. CAU 1602]
MKQHQATCDVVCYDEEKVVRLKGLDWELGGVSSIFKALADETRLKIAYMLAQEGECCVCDVANVLETSIATASHHLRLLKNQGLAKSRKEGKWVLYSLDDDHVLTLIQMALHHAKEGKSDE